MSNEHGTEASTAGFSMERITRNDAIFREANEGIRDAAEEHVENRDGDVLVPFICECADPNCTEIVRVTLEQYREVRSQPRLFLNVPGHQASAHGWAAAVSGQDGCIIVEKLGPAGELAEALEDEELLPRKRTA
jgi:hypothetical protein